MGAPLWQHRGDVQVRGGPGGGAGAPRWEGLLGHHAAPPPLPLIYATLAIPPPHFFFCRLDPETGKLQYEQKPDKHQEEEGGGQAPTAEDVAAEQKLRAQVGAPPPVPPAPTHPTPFS